LRLPDAQIMTRDNYSSEQLSAGAIKLRLRQLSTAVRKTKRSLPARQNIQSAISLTAMPSVIGFADR
jgi:hypothetical protein